MATYEPLPDEELDPTTEQGRANLDQTVDDERDELIKQDDETVESWKSRIKRRFKEHFDYVVNRLVKTSKGSVPEYLKMADLNEVRKREANIEEAKRNIDKLFSSWKKSEMLCRINKRGETEVAIKREVGDERKSAWHKLESYEDFEKLPKTLKKFFIRRTDEDIEYTEGKEAIDKLYPENKLPDTWNGDLDIGWDNELSIYDKKSNKWNKLDALPPKVKNLLGRPAAEILEEGDKEIAATGEQLRHIEPQVEVINRQIEEDEQSIASNKSLLENLERQANDAPDGDEQERIKREHNRLIQENNELVESRDAQQAHKSRLQAQIRELQAKKEELEENQEAIEEKNIFTNSLMTFKTAKEARRWLDAPNLAYWSQALNFAVWCSTAGCGVTRDMLDDSQVGSFYKFHVIFMIRRVLSELQCPLPSDKHFSEFYNFYNKASYQKLRTEFKTSNDFRYISPYSHGLGLVYSYDYHGLNSDSRESYTPYKGELQLSDEWKSTNHQNHFEIVYVKDPKTAYQYEWFFPEKSRGLTKAGLSRINQSIEAFVYCILGSQAQTRNSIQKLINYS
ncbi:hypothetical protein AC249_AIPGENE15532 [Exaiptasia diaphana]|nr:hypothetical protein AC249_AIPGENE15532 [Exaiptasia diaphana]